MKMKNNQVIFQNLNVNYINSSSGIFFGTNLQMNFLSSTKSNSCISITGRNNQIVKNFSIINDEDGIEVTTTKA